MRNPIRSETDAFYATLAGAGLTGASVAVGALAGPDAGVALFAGGIAGAVAWDVATKDPDRRRPLREAAQEGRRHDTPPARRVLVVANRTLGSKDLETVLRGHAKRGAEVRIVVPVLVSRVHYIVSDVDRELREARARLAAAMVWANAAGLRASGKVGDPNVALGGIEDELREFGADEVVISTLPPGRSNWLDTGIVEHLREELDIPVSHVVAELDHDTLAANR